MSLRKQLDDWRIFLFIFIILDVRWARNSTNLKGHVIFYWDN